MGDDDVLQWLSPEETIAYVNTYSFTGNKLILLPEYNAAFKAMAETRRMLSFCEMALSSCFCPDCDGSSDNRPPHYGYNHRDGCIFKVMPQPKKPVYD